MTENTIKTKYESFSPKYIACIPECYNKVFVECKNDFQVIFFQKKGTKELYCCSPMNNQTNSIIYCTVSIKDTCISLQKVACLEEKYNLDFAIIFLKQENTAAGNNIYTNTTELIDDFNAFCDNLEEKRIEVKKFINEKIIKTVSIKNEDEKTILSYRTREETTNEIKNCCSVTLTKDRISVEYSFPSNYYGKMDDSYRKLLKMLEKQYKDIDFTEDDTTKSDINNFFNEMKNLEFQSLQPDLNKKTHPKTIIRL